MKKIVLVKIGGSSITNINVVNSAKIEAISRLATEIKEGGKKFNVLLGHGGGSFPHVPAHKYKTGLGLINEKSHLGASLTQSSASELHSIVMQQLIKHDIPAFSFPPSASAIAKDRRIVKWDIEPIKKALDNGFMPVTYGDVVLDLKQGVCISPTEELFRYIASKLRPTQIIIGTDVDGVYTCDPKTSKEAKLIPLIDSNNINSVSADVGKLRKFNVTGGMGSKIRFLHNISVNMGTECIILNANKKNRLKDALMGKTVISTKIVA